MPRPTLHARALERAADLAGGEKSLASHLRISEARLQLYLKGTALCPPEISRKVVAVLLEHELAALGGSRSN
jgi:hypothetical protein